MTSEELPSQVAAFFSAIGSGEIDIYNEYSLHCFNTQHKPTMVMEFKFSRAGQVPLQTLKFCRDMGQYPRALHGIRVAKKDKIFQIGRRGPFRLPSA